MRKRIDVLETTFEERIQKAVEESVSKAVEPLYIAIAEKDKGILQLKSQLGKDSSNSSKPSGGNGFKKVPSNREKSKKNRGGQYGHKGSRLNIAENLNELVKSGMAEHVIVSDVPDGEPYISDCKATIAGFISDATNNTDLTGNVQDLLNGQVINIDETPIKTSGRPNKDGVLETPKTLHLTPIY